ncbi:MAG: hypothetical protein KC910_10850 [Candidatus Eremiobacteraeota bacterium]|nr:hypothetical protein [Candidatus Eremiobacteraeota bacterium]
MTPLRDCLVALAGGLACAPLGCRLAGPEYWDRFCQAWAFHSFLAALPFITVFMLWPAEPWVRRLGIGLLWPAALLGQVLAWAGSNILHGGGVGFFLFPALVFAVGLAYGSLSLLINLYQKAREKELA